MSLINIFLVVVLVFVVDHAPAQVYTYYHTRPLHDALPCALLGPDRGVHPHRIGDAEAREGVYLQTLLVGRQHLLALHVDAQDALVDLLDRIGEGHTDDEPGARAAEILSRLIPVHRALDLTEAQDQRLLVLGNDRQRLRQEDDQHDGPDQQPHRVADQRFEHHSPPFVTASAGGLLRRLISGSAR